VLTDTKLRSQVDQLWEKLWSGGLSNPLDAIEQLSYLIFIKRLDDAENAREKQARRLNQPYIPRLPDEIRWNRWTRYEAPKALKHLKEVVFPWLQGLGGEDSSFTRYMQTAEFKINRPSLLIEAARSIDEMQISAQNQDVQGDLYEYLLSKLNTAGRNGQFRTPRHIIRMMVQMIDPKPTDRIGDLAAGTCGFLVNAYQYILEKHTSPEILEYDAEGMPHHAVGDQLTPEQRMFLQTKALRGYDNDSGMTMLRIGSMNLMLHGIESPRFYYMDTLSKDFEEVRDYDVILMNPPFKGAVDKSEVNPTLPENTTKSELLFLSLILRALDMGGRCAVIVPDGVLFGRSKAHLDIRRAIIETNRLEGVVSMPSGVFKPYAGVSTAVLIFTKGANTDRVWFYDMGHDGFSLDDKRLPVRENDIPDIVESWLNRHDPAYENVRGRLLAELRAEVAPLKAERLRIEEEINRLSFEAAIASEDDEVADTSLRVERGKLAGLMAQISPLQLQINQLSRQFWVSKRDLKVNQYDLSTSRYRQIDLDEAFYERSVVTIARLRRLNSAMDEEVQELERLLT
jgi:type I restriction enzyme M protein